MEYIKIASQGEMNPRGLTFLGASTKRTDSSKIGYFGSGAKHFTACYLREGVPFKVYTGTRHIPVNTKPEEFCGETYQTVYVDGQRTDCSTGFGPDWRLWMGLREVYSNAIDAGRHSMTIVDEISPIADETHFYIQLTPEMKTIWEHLGDYFSEFRNDLMFYDVALGEVYQKVAYSPISMYRKGIRCADERTKSYFDYNFYDIDINESRIIKDRYVAYRKVAQLWASSTSVSSKHIFTLLDAIGDDSSYEYNALSWSGGDVKYSEAWNCLENKIICPIKFKSMVSADYYLPYDMIKGLINSKVKFKSALEFSDNHAYTKVDDDFINAIMHKAEEFLDTCHYPVNVDWVIGKFADDNIAMCITNKDLRQVVIDKTKVQNGSKDAIKMLIFAQGALTDSVRDSSTGIIDNLLEYLQKTNAIVI